MLSISQDINLVIKNIVFVMALRGKTVALSKNNHTEDGYMMSVLRYFWAQCRGLRVLVTSSIRYSMVTILRSGRRRATPHVQAGIVGWR
jgi:hypothetical protein